MSAKVFFGAFCLLLQAVPAPTSDPHFFRYQRALTTADTIPGQSCTPLDAAVFSHATRGLADLRLYQGTREVPYVIQLVGGGIPTTDSEPAILNLGTHDGRVVFDVHLFHRPYSDLEIVTDAKDFVASVAVSGSQSQDMHTATRLGTFTIFDFTRQRLSRSTVLHLPVSNFAYLHFSLDGPLKPSNISGVTAREVAEQPPVYRTIVESHRVTQRGRLSTVTFEVPSGVPVERVTVLPASPMGNFSRDVMLDATLAGGAWHSNIFGTILRVHTVQNARHIDEERYALEVPGGPPRDTGTVRWTVTIDNGDDPPLALQTVRLEMRERTLCFDAQGGASYTLYYGDTTLAPPRYDYATLFQLADHPHPVTMGVEASNPIFRSRPDTRPFTERFRGVLWGVLLCVVVLLGGIAVRSAGRLSPPG